MITEDYVSFETAKLLKEKGFNVSVSSYYDTDGKLINIVTNWNYNAGSYNYSAPTLQLTMKWLREVHNIDIEVQINYFGNLKPNNYRYYRGKILKAGKGAIHTIYTKFTYEEVCKDAIKYCLENLI